MPENLAISPTHSVIARYMSLGRDAADKLEARCFRQLLPVEATVRGETVSSVEDDDERSYTAKMHKRSVEPPHSLN